LLSPTTNSAGNFANANFTNYKNVYGMGFEVAWIYAASCVTMLPR